MNSKAISGTLAAIIIVGILVVVGLAAAYLMSPALAPKSDITVYIEGVAQTGDYTQPQTYDWGQLTNGYTYTRNFTVENTGAQPYNIVLVTTQPPGTTATWSQNNTQLPSATYTDAPLTYIYTPSTAGAFTWKLISSNTSLPTATPTAAPEDTVYEFTLLPVAEGMANLNVTINTAKYSFTPSTIPEAGVTFYYEQGDTLRYATQSAEGYTFNFWSYNDVPTGGGSNPYTITSASGNFTIKPTYTLAEVT